MNFLFQDWKVNSRNLKGQIVMLLFRLATMATYNKWVLILFIPYLILYKVLVEWFLGIELPFKTNIGSNTKLFHAHSLVVNKGTVIGNNCTLRQSTTIGNKILKDGLESTCPIIGNNVEIGANVCIIGPIIIGNNVQIGAGSVVVKNIPNDCIVVGNPARIIKYLTN
jgi:putative colanic acid biosynthesis acetyltransferase WcaB